MTTATTRRHWLRPAAAVVSLALVLQGTVQAGGYTYDPSSAHERGPSTVYFGSARTAEGKYISGVTIVITTPTVDFVVATDDAGRFRLELPMQMAVSDVTARCSKPGMTVVRVSKRPYPGKDLTPVEVNCLLK